MHDVLHVPDFHYNLLSASKLTKQISSNLIFISTECLIQDPQRKKTPLLGEEAGGLHLVDGLSCNNQDSGTSNKCNAVLSQFSDVELWHCRLGHMPIDKLKHRDSISVCKSFSMQSSICHICPQSRQHRFPFPDSTSSSTCVFELIRVDIWGPYYQSTSNGFKYFLTIVDDFLMPLGYIFYL